MSPLHAIKIVHRIIGEIIETHDPPSEKPDKAVAKLQRVRRIP